MMTGALSTPRHGAEDFETASIRSAAPSYVSDVPSYHSTAQFPDTAPAYAPRATASDVASPARHRQSSTPRPLATGLPPIPPVSSQGAIALRDFRAPTFFANNAPAARQYRNVAERRITDGRYQMNDPTRRPVATERPPVVRVEEAPQGIRPLEDPYLVGEVAAAQARRERLARESGDDILIREDRQWDWLLLQMKSWEERERTWAKYRREIDNQQRKKLLRRIGGRLLS
ncbi:hypothetical protein DCS_01809 [Drechmeria coniospora]|uniref:Uncharacterized protein n=1 Tax=Drechmeria coniospora TaxID=98403 RepID=A0A151GUC3_DRECN|nr:hypothetical protein DCS_01809 [Drechmeria coniospora]KYK60671.1 hypothetical protein DCS_01809 [Drechmeria coniospora]ODA83358.1 hypothetical protein RJ55_01871 [Drechmeria coniospora]